MRLIKHKRILSIMKGITDDIRSKIHNIRGMQVMLDRDLAGLYEVTTKNLNKAVSRNIERFPADFMFQLTENEYKSLRLQNGILRFQNGTSSSMHGGRRYLPYAFTEQGVASISGILRNEKAVQVNILIMRAFVAMRRFIASNAQVFQEISDIKTKLIDHDRELEKVFEAIEARDIKPQKGIFFDGQVFDAYRFVSDIIRSADRSIVLIDNYVDDSVLSLLTKRKKEVSAVIFTKKVEKQLKLDLKKHNSQYARVEIKEFRHCHDRFMIIDEEDVYHFGASLKDLGKKWFGFSKFDKEAFRLMERLENI